MTDNQSNYKSKKMGSNTNTNTANDNSSNSSISSLSQSPPSPVLQHDTVKTPPDTVPVATPTNTTYPKSEFEYVTNTSQSPVVSDMSNTPKKYEYLDIKVAGVTFKNDKGPTRQTLLKKIKEHSAPFDEFLDISLNQYEFDGELAYSICVNDRQIGNVPKSQVQYLHDNVNRFIAITDIKVYGGYRDENGYFKSYGATITVKLRLSENS